MVTQHPFNVTGMKLSGYMIKDAPRALAFYRDVLGRKPAVISSDERGAKYELPMARPLASGAEAVE